MFDRTDLINAQKLAYFLISCPRTYLLVIAEAAERAMTQTRRQEEHFAEPAKKQPVCVNWKLRHLLQLWICESAKQYEKNAWPQEEINDDSRARRATTWMIRFIRDVATWRMVELNSFRATVGMTEVLHQYDRLLRKEPEYCWIRQQLAPGDGKDLSYYRRCYGALLKYLATPERFGSLITIEKNGVKNRIRSRPDSNALAQQVRNMFEKYLTLWGTNHPDDRALEKSYYFGCSITSYSTAEEIRAHRLLCPECFSGIMSSLKVCQPENRLQLPEFIMSNEFFKGPPSGKSLSDEDAADNLALLETALTGKIRQRAKYKPGMVSLFADGVLIGTWNLAAKQRQSVSLSSDQRMIEVRTPEGLLLATHFASYDDIDEKWEPGLWTVRLEAGQQFLFSAKEAASNQNELVMEYRETSFKRVVSLALRRLQHKGSSLFSVKSDEKQTHKNISGSGSQLLWPALIRFRSGLGIAIGLMSLFLVALSALNTWQWWRIKDLNIGLSRLETMRQSERQMTRTLESQLAAVNKEKEELQASLDRNRQTEMQLSLAQRDNDQLRGQLANSGTLIVRGPERDLRGANVGKDIEGYLRYDLKADSNGPEILSPKFPDMIYIRFETPRKSYPKYFIKLQTIDGRIIWDAETVTPQNKDKTATYEIRLSTVLPYDEYRLTLFGKPSDGEPVVIEEKSFRLRK